QADALGVTERERVVARSPRPLRGSSDYIRANALHEPIDLVDILAAAGAEAQMVDPGRELLVGVRRKLRVRAPDTQGRPAADVIDENGRAKHSLKPESRHQRVVEGDARLEAVYAQHDVCHTVDLHSIPPDSFCSPPSLRARLVSRNQLTAAPRA